MEDWQLYDSSDSDDNILSIGGISFEGMEDLQQYDSSDYDERNFSIGGENVEPRGSPARELVPVLVNDEANDNTRKRCKREKKPLLMWQKWQQEYDKLVDQNMADDVNLDNHNDVISETAEPSSDIIVPLLRYQKEWLAWALKQEESSVKGGILADEMGMGKTVQAIALVLTKRALHSSIGSPQHSLSTSAGPLKCLPSVKTTLVICPVAAVAHWVDEINCFTSEGSTKVLVYHGSGRRKSIQQFENYDFVITTYSLVEMDYRKHIQPFQKEKLVFHLRDACGCGPGTFKTAQQSKQQKNAPLIKPNMDSGIDDISDSEDEQKSDEESHLHSVHWNRIILDEAQFIKEKCSNTANAVSELKSHYKSALTGTPIQNKLGDIYSLVKPFAYCLCRDCNCEKLYSGIPKPYAECSHLSDRHFTWLRGFISGFMVDKRRAKILLKHKVMKTVLLRRTKRNRAADLALPTRIDTLRRDTFDVTEQYYYVTVHDHSQSQFNTYIAAGTLTTNYGEMFALLMLLRKAADHPYLVLYSESTPLESENSFSIKNVDHLCGICNGIAEDPVVTSCRHSFCKACLTDLSTSEGKVSCPQCSKPLTVDLSTSRDVEVRSKRTSIEGFKASSILNRIKLDDFRTSTKIEALREEIMWMIKRDGSAKGIVFSHFISFLDLIHYSLIKSGICCVRLTGDMTIFAKEEAVKKFTEDSDYKIFLVSLRAGRVALNLIAASHAFMIDPWWNPTFEQQLLDRIDRIGQTKPIRIVRFMIENTVEERILELQKNKKLAFEGNFRGLLKDPWKLTEDDLKFLFSRNHLFSS